MTDRFRVDEAHMLCIGNRRYPCSRFRKITVFVPPPALMIREALIPMENGWAALLDWGTESFSANHGRRGETFEEEPAAVQILIGSSFDPDDVVLFLPFMSAPEAIEALDAVSCWSTGVVGELAGTHEK